MTEQAPLTQQTGRAKVEEILATGNIAAIAFFRALSQISVVFRDLDRPSGERQPPGVHMDVVRHVFSLHRPAIVGAAIETLFEAVKCHPGVDPADLASMIIDRANREEIDAGRKLHTVFGLFKEFEGEDILAIFEAELKKAKGGKHAGD